MNSRIAMCSCGQLRATCEGDPDFVSLCHCLECKKRTGSSFGIAAFFQEGCVEIAGQSSEYSRPSDSGHRVTFHFCPGCGTTLFWRPSRKPEVVAVAAGAFADPSFPAPTQDVFTEHRHEWIKLAF